MRFSVRFPLCLTTKFWMTCQAATQASVTLAKFTQGKSPSPSSRRQLSFKVCSLQSFFFTSDVCLVSTYPSRHLSVLVPVQVQVNIGTLRCQKYCRNKKVTHERGGLSLRTHRDVIAHRMTIGSIMAWQTWHTDATNFDMSILASPVHSRKAKHYIWKTDMGSFVDWGIYKASRMTACKKRFAFLLDTGTCRKCIKQS